MLGLWNDQKNLKLKTIEIILKMMCFITANISQKSQHQREIISVGKPNVLNVLRQSNENHNVNFFVING